MANSIKIKRSAVAAKVPLTTDLALGELAINTYDGKLYLKKDNGTASIVTVNAGGGGSGDVVGPGSSTDNAITRFDGVTGLLIQNSTATLDDSGVISVSGANVSGLTASSAVATDASKNLVSVANTGTGDNVLATSPTLITPALGTPTALVGTNISGTASGLSIGGNAGTVTGGVYTTDTSTVTNTMLAGSIANAKLVNSSITINGTSTSLGGSISVGTVTSVTGTSPISSSGGATPGISISAAGVSTSGYLSATDWNTFNNKGSGTVTAVSVATANGVSGSSSGGATPALTIALGAITPSAVQVSGLTASQILSTDASKNLTSLAVATYPSLTELTYVKGVTSAIQTQINAKGAGTVTSVGFTGGIISVATGTTTPAFTVAGTSGGIPYFSSGTTWATSTLLAASSIMLGGGAGAAPTTTTTGTGVVAALGVAVGSAGAFITFNGAAGTPSSITLTNAGGTAASLTAGTATTANGVAAGVVAGKMIYDQFTATAAQTTFTTSVTYISGKIEVYANGVKMVNAADVTVTSGTSVVFTTGVALNTRVDLVYPT